MPLNTVSNIVITVPTFDSYVPHILLWFRPDVNEFRAANQKDGCY